MCIRDSTCSLLARELASKRGVTVITNSVFLCNFVRRCPALDVVLPVSYTHLVVGDHAVLELTAEGGIELLIFFTVVFLEKKVKAELLKLQKDDREKYEQFYSCLSLIHIWRRLR